MERGPYPLTHAHVLDPNFGSTGVPPGEIKRNRIQARCLGSRLRGFETGCGGKAGSTAPWPFPHQTRGTNMCLAIPMRIVAIDGFLAVAEVDGVRREARLDLLPEAAVGDYILVHAGLAIATVDQEAAEETLTVLRQLSYDEVQ